MDHTPGAEAQTQIPHSPAHVGVVSPNDADPLTWADFTVTDHPANDVVRCIVSFWATWRNMLLVAPTFTFRITAGLNGLMGGALSTPGADDFTSGSTTSEGTEEPSQRLGTCVRLYCTTVHRLANRR